MEKTNEPFDAEEALLVKEDLRESEGFIYLHQSRLLIAAPGGPKNASCRHDPENRVRKLIPHAIVVMIHLELTLQSKWRQAGLVRFSSLTMTPGRMLKFFLMVSTSSSEDM
jgi:hypothetical protein